MMKRSIQDIVVKRATKQIPKKNPPAQDAAPSRVSKKVPKQFEYRTEEVFYEELETVVRGPSHDFPPVQPDSNSQKIWWFIAFISVGVLIFALSFFFSGATVVITPKIVPITLKDEVFIAKRTAPVDSLGFETMSLSGEVSKTILSTSSKEVNIKAVGEVMLYNGFSTKGEKVAKGTELVSTNGKIYKTKNTVTVPGYTLDTAKKNIPGSVRVAIEASISGAEYNQEATDLSFKNFTGTKKEKIYARSVGAITGGQVGMIAVLDDTVRAQMVDELTQTLRQKLLSQAEVQIPKDFLFYPESAKLAVETKEIPIEGDQTAISMVQSGTMDLVLMNKKTLSKSIAKIADSEYDDAPIYIPELATLAFSYEPADVSGIKDIPEVRFRLIGDARVVWEVDTASIQKSLLGTREKDFKKMTSEYLSVDAAELTITPFWIKTIPEKSEKVTVVIKNIDLSEK